jgi:hypothetical protein
MTTRYNNLGNIAHSFRFQRVLIFGIIILTALFAFEAFNYGTTHYALSDLLGSLSFAGLTWATILAIAFCGIDFAGIARLFAPESGGKRDDGWFLFGAWMLAATMNAMLTWWGVSLAILNHQSSGTAVIERETLLRIVPVFVAIMVWLIRVLMIGTFSIAGDRLFALKCDQAPSSRHLDEPARTRPEKPVNYTNLPATNSARINIPSPSSKTSRSTPSVTNGIKGGATSSPQVRTFTNLPPTYSSPPQPDYPSDDELTISEPAYVSPPLAASSKGRPLPGNGNKGSTTRAPTGNQRF